MLHPLLTQILVIEIEKGNANFTSITGEFELLFTFMAPYYPCPET